MRTWLAATLLAFCAPLLAGTPIERLEADLAQAKAELQELKAGAGEEDQGLATRLRDHLFTWRSQDGRFALKMESLVQFRYLYRDVRANSGQGGDNGADFHNFRVHYLRLRWEGHLFGPSYSYNVELAPLSESGGLAFDELWFRWEPLPLFNLTAGQQRTPFSYEQGVDPGRRTFLERSSADKAFDQGFAKGLEIAGVADFWAERVLFWSLGIYNGVLERKNARPATATIDFAGQRSDGVRVQNAAALENQAGNFRNSDRDLLEDRFDDSVDADFMLNLRVEFHVMGDIGLRASDGRSSEDWDDWKFMVGLAACYFNARVDGGGTLLGNNFHAVQAPSGVIPSPGSGRRFIRAETLAMTVDGHFRGFGFSVNWALFYRRVEFHHHGRLEGSNLRGRYIAAAAQDTGFSVDIAYKIEAIDTLLASRCSLVNYDEFGSQTVTGQPVDGDSFGADTVEWGGSASLELHGDHLKLTLDYRYVIQQLPHGTGKGKDSTSGVERVSEYRNFQEIRLQLQWIF